MPKEIFFKNIFIQHFKRNLAVFYRVFIPISNKEILCDFNWQIKVQIIASSLILRHATNDRAIKRIKLKPI